MMNSIEKAGQLIKQSENIVAFTGAGASTESSIPDFRSAQGLYGKGSDDFPYPPETMLSISFFYEKPDVFYDFYRSKLVYRNALPNDCHRVLASLEKEGRLSAVVTQNIDGLHQAAGSCSVIELHGSVYRNYCMECGRKYDIDYIFSIDKKVPECTECKGIVRPDVVMYGEQLDSLTVEKAVEAVSGADVLLVIGTSLVVYPAAGFIRYYSGNSMILINRTPTPYDSMAAVVINEPAGRTLKQIKGV